MVFFEIFNFYFLNIIFCDVRHGIIEFNQVPAAQ